MFRLLLVVLAFIVYGSLYPFQFHFDRAHTSPLEMLLHSWPARVDRFLWRDACVNVLLYFPLGLTATLVAARRLPRVAAAVGAVLLGVGLSASIEMLQIFDSSRTCSLLDVACNFAGAAGGAAAALVFERQILQIMQHRRGNRGAGGGLMLACCWAGYQLYPFIPRLGRGYLRASLARFLATPIAPVEVYASAAEWFALALVLRAVSSRETFNPSRETFNPSHDNFNPSRDRKGAVPRATLWLLLAMLCLPLRLVTMERGLAPAEVIGAALAMLVWTYPAEGTRSRGGAIALGVAIVLRELSPFEFSGPARAMSWLPFSATLDSERLNAALVLLRKAFDYGTLVWLLRASGVSYLRGGALAAAGLLVLEFAQRYMPNHQPELTDSVIVLLMAGVLWGIESSRRHKPQA